MNFKEKLNKGKFVVTVEITPPRGPDPLKLIEKIKELRNLVDAVNFTDNPSAKLRMCSMAACKLSLDLGLEPVLQITCRDRNRIAIQSDLLGAHALGIRNLLLMTGDHPIVGDHKEAKAVYDIDSSILIKVVKGLNEGIDINGNKLNGKTEFFFGAVVNPSAIPLMPQLKRFEQKLKMGAEFFQTQMIFDIEKFESFIDYTKMFDSIKIIAGIVIIKSRKMLNYLANKVSGVIVPDWLVDKIKRFSKDEDIEKFGFEFAVELIQKIRQKALCSGIHIMATRNIEDIKNLLSLIKN
ncbi:MAG: methylenetetrahydrofolate reductase [Thermodesulfovibrio sp.]|nr:methylenetetrahydrofolate reductase [Thermodesulfovibrio sp.]MDW7972945.1 methylenetetrahydrofolate reductase [Thermodesulfovibrio sp.]